MTYTAMDFSSLIGMEGFSDALLGNHFTLYQGYVKNTNKLVETLAIMLKEERTVTPEYAELKRRFGFEINGLRLHEYYFENLGGNGILDGTNRLATRIVEDFGSYQAWEKDFKATGNMRGIGWVVLYHDTKGDRLFNQWINEHEIGHLAGGSPILVMDVFEHAFMTDYGLKRPDYIAAFIKNINWSVATTRYK
jgi:Fe-Mn family superoxide dismutase